MTDEHQRDVYEYVEAKCAEFENPASGHEKAILRTELLPGEHILAVAKVVAVLSSDDDGSREVLNRGLLVATSSRVLFLRQSWFGGPHVFTLPIESIQTVSSSAGALSTARILITCIDGRNLSADAIQPKDRAVRFVDALNGYLAGDQATEDGSSHSVSNTESDQGSQQVYDDAGSESVGFDSDILSEMLGASERVVHDVRCEFAVGVREDGQLRTMSRGNGSFLITDARLIFARPAFWGRWSVEEIPLNLIKTVTVDPEGVLRITGRSVAFCNISDIPVGELGPIIACLQNRSTDQASDDSDSNSSWVMPPSKSRVTPTSAPSAEVGTDQRAIASDSRSSGSEPPSKPEVAPTSAASADIGAESRNSTNGSDSPTQHTGIRCLKAVVVISIAIVVIVTAVRIFDDGRRYSDGWQQCRSSEGGSSSFYMTEEKESQGFDPCRRYSSDSWARRPTPTPVRVDYEFPTRTARPRKLSAWNQHGRRPIRRRCRQERDGVVFSVKVGCQHSQYLLSYALGEHGH